MPRVRPSEGLYCFLQEPIELNNHVNLTEFHKCTSKRTKGAMKQLVLKCCRLTTVADALKTKYFNRTCRSKRIKLQKLVVLLKTYEKTNTVQSLTMLKWLIAYWFTLFKLSDKKCTVSSQ